MSLGTVTGNRYSGAHKSQPKPDLQQRLKEQTQRTTPQGTFKTGPDGRMEYVPKMVPTHNQQVLQRMRATKTEPTPEMDAKRAAEEARSAAAFVPGAMVRITDMVDALWLQDPWPFTLELAKAVAGLIGRVDGHSEDGHGVYVEVDGNRLLLLPENLRTLNQAELRDALQPAEGDDEREAMGLAGAEAGVLSPSEAAQEFEPLRVGDKVQTLTGLVGVVVSLSGDITVVHHPAWNWPAQIQRKNLKLVKKAGV